ncbi:hypothetical protein BD560DRAFT_426137 [Blakeslea trispora]|nr:hypothetical protein BD560DRAFT_426137 [Blakeslea trispora]
MSEAAPSSISTPPTDNTKLDSVGQKRPAPEQTNENRDIKTVKLESAANATEETSQQNNTPVPELIVETPKQDNASNHSTVPGSSDNTNDKNHPKTDNSAINNTSSTSTNKSNNNIVTTNTNTNAIQTNTTPPQLSQEENQSTPNRPLLSIQQHPPPPLHPPVALHLLTESQHQLIQSYVQAQGHPDLTNLTASSLAQAMVSPIAVPGLANNLLQQLQQGGNIITALPGPPPQIPHHPHLPHPHSHPVSANGTPDLTDGSMAAGSKRVNSRSLSNDERRQRRLLRNRVAAKECRKKKKQHIHEMEEKIEKLEKENAKLTKEVEELKAKLSLGAMQGPEGYRLMKEVEELNAKLGMSGALGPSNLNINSSPLTTAPAQSSNTPTQLQPQPQSQPQEEKEAEAEKQKEETLTSTTNQNDESDKTNESGEPTPSAITSDSSTPAITVATSI